MKKNPPAFSHPLLKGATISERKKAFTLVELIIVITILAILATIAFVSFSNYAKESRDAQRLSSLTNIEKGIDVYGIEVGRFPIPENSTSFTGGANSEIKQGILTKNVLPNLGSTPVDPVSGKNYTYSVFGNGKYYQIATGLENELSHSLGARAYANTFKTTKLVGNYRYDPSLPSLIIGSGANIFSPDTCFVTNGGTDTLDNCTTKKSDLSGKNTDSSLVGYWDMETRTDDNLRLKDLSGNGNHGTGSGAIIIGAAIGEVGSATLFNSGSKHHFIVNDSNSLDIEGKFTFSVIVLGSELYGDYISKSKGSTGSSVTEPYRFGTQTVNAGNYTTIPNTNDIRGKNIYLRGSTSYNIPTTIVSNYSALTTLGNFPPNTFERNIYFSNLNLSGNKHTITSTFENGLHKMYYNGVKVEEVFFKEFSIWKSDGNLFIGSRSSTSAPYFNGIIDEVKIYNRALSDEEILQQARIAGF